MPAYSDAAHAVARSPLQFSSSFSLSLSLSFSLPFPLQLPLWPFVPFVSSW